MDPVTGLSPSVSRRAILGGAAALAATVARRGSAGEASPAWVRWRSMFLAPDGRVIDDGQGGLSHSEGQGYGLLLAQAFDDREAFDRIEAWTRANLATRQDPLMAWCWRDGSVRDWRNATDGDVLRAWALCRAGRDSGWTGHDRVMRDIAEAVAGICLAPDPRAPSKALLKPADRAPASAKGVLVNPSYYLTVALRELASAADLPVLAEVADHGEAILADPRAMRDWVAVTPDGLHPPEGHADRCGWDAVRIPLHLAWAGRWDHPAMATIRRRLHGTTVPGHVAVVTDPDGGVLSQSDAPGIVAMGALAAGRPPGPADPTGQGYYPATLTLLAQVAWDEGGGARRPEPPG